MTKVGLLVNPVSGTDIRRIYSTAEFMDAVQKARIIKSILAGIEAMDVDEVLVMPDFYSIAARAVNEYLKSNRNINIYFLEMKPKGEPNDTIEAVNLMVKERVGAIVLLGGDGTVRLASKVSGVTPLMPISTGTNNVVPYRVDGTIAGLAAGAVASGYSNRTFKMKKINVYVNGSYVDQALVDVASTQYPFIASKAINDIYMVKEILVAYAPPGAIGLASIAAMIHPIGLKDDTGIYITLESNHNSNKKTKMVKAILFPGVIENVKVKEYEFLKPGRRIQFTNPLTIALDGEREIMIDKGDVAEAEISFDGPVIIDLEKVLENLASTFNINSEK